MPHPTGYPTYVLLLAAAVRLTPSDPALGGNWLSAISAALAVALLSDAALRVAGDGPESGLLGGVPGVEPARVVVLGAGVVGSAATRIAVGMGALVTVINLDVDRLRYLDDQYHGRIVTLASTTAAIEQAVLAADLVIGAVLLPGALAPKLVSRHWLPG